MSLKYENGLKTLVRKLRFILPIHLRHIFDNDNMTSKKNNFSKHSIRLDEIIQSGIVNSIRISSDFQVIAAAVAQENRTGRWMVNKAVVAHFFSKSIRVC